MIRKREPYRYRHEGIQPPGRHALVIGPAYVDRVIRIDRPLLDPKRGGTIDRSIQAVGKPRADESGRLRLVGVGGGAVAIQPPPGWPGPIGSIRLSEPLAPGRWRRQVQGLSWHDDLGGMGAGFAAALGATLVSAVGEPQDAIAREVAERLAVHYVDHRPIPIPRKASDWTLLVSSGPHGDKLPVGFRGCHADLRREDVGRYLIGLRPGLVVAAGLPNYTAISCMISFRDAVRVMAPSRSTLFDRFPPFCDLGRFVDLVALNRGEWELITEYEQNQLIDSVPVISITDGPRGATLKLRGLVEDIHVDAFPRRLPPIDTNRAGEAFAATLVSELVDKGWHGKQPPDPALAHAAAVRASAAAALVLDRDRFGFPTPLEIDAALKVGVVGGDGASE